jgi:hypothetical protein
MRMSDADAAACREVDEWLRYYGEKPAAWSLSLPPFEAIGKLLRLLRNEWYEEQAESAASQPAALRVTRRNRQRLVYYNLPPVVTAEAQDIVDKLLPQWLQLFLNKNAQYMKVSHLGARGVFPDINRKVGALQRLVWEGEGPAEGSEDAKQVMLDLIGHLFLMAALWDNAPVPEVAENSAADGGWDYLPHSIRQVLRKLAKSSSVGISEPEWRVVTDYLSVHDKGPDAD